MQSTQHKTRATVGLSKKQPRIITAKEFRDRFTTQERGAIWQAALTDTTIGALLMDVFTAPDIALDADNVRGGMDTIAAHGLITEPRKIEILM